MEISKINTLLEDCSSHNSVKQIRAIDELFTLKAYETILILLTLLKSSDAVVRFSVVQALTKISTKDNHDLIGKTLINLLNDSESIVKSEAIDSLGILKYTPARDYIKYLLKNDPDPLVRASAAETLGDLADITVIPDLELALDDSDESVKSYAVNSLGILGNKSLLYRLKNHCERESSLRVKAEILGARLRLEDKECLTELLNILENSDEDLATCKWVFITIVIYIKVRSWALALHCKG
jgi:HEAT repeat protein